ncbi:MAG: M28 family peptidase [Cytophagales bacterium]|nr:M28 family peptidase [Cytophagales bacterium]
MKRLVIFYLALLMPGVMDCYAQKGILREKEVAQALNAVNKTAIEDRIRYLADDKLLGRLPGTPGYAMAVEFVINELKSMGIKPVGGKDYIQQVPLRLGRVDTAQSSLAMTGPSGLMRLRYGKDYTFAPDLIRSETLTETSLVFAGYGISAPHLKHNDYTNLDVKGKIVVVQDGTPSDFPASERAHFNLASSKCEMANLHGAVGVLIIVTGNEAARLGGLTRTSTQGITAYVKPDGKPFSSRTNGYEGVAVLGYVRGSLFGDMLTDKTPRDLPYQINAKLSSVHINSTSENVVGLIPGTDATLKNEYVVHTAHLDHVGVGVPVRGDSIYNGAHDNASGTACLLEIGRLYTKAKVKRSVLIAFVTSEEKGLLGSGYFAENPPVPKQHLVANINTDMPTVIAPLLSIEPLGASHSSMMKEVKSAAAFLGLDVMEDHMPEQVRFVRSDQYSFIRQGVPALHVKYGLKSKEGVDLRKQIDDWTAAHYHQPSDEYSPEAFDFDAAAVYVKLNFLIGWQIANAAARPQWNPGDFFGETFGMGR